MKIQDICWNVRKQVLNIYIFRGFFFNFNSTHVDYVMIFNAIQITWEGSKNVHVSDLFQT